MDESLRAIADLEWPGPDRSGRIEEFLMQQNEAVKGGGIVRRRMGLWLGVAAVLASGVVYGSVRMYQRYSVHLNVNGVEQRHQVEAGPDGTALVEVPLEGGGTARILVGPENMGKDGVINAGISVHPGTEKVKKEQTLVIKEIGPVKEDAKDASPPKPAVKPPAKPAEKPAETKELPAAPR